MTLPSYTIHASSSVPSVPPQLTPSEGFSAKLRRFSPESVEVSRGAIIRMISGFESYTSQLRETFDRSLASLSQSARELGRDSSIPNNAADSLNYVVSRLKALRNSPAISATEENAEEGTIGNYIVRFAEHYPEQPEIDKSSPKARIKSVLRTVTGDSKPTLSKEASMNREALFQLITAQEAVIDELSLINEHLTRYEQQAGLRNQPSPEPLTKLHDQVVNLVDKLKCKATQFSGALERQLDLLPAVSSGAAYGR